jgi:hypothetical protein
MTFFTTVAVGRNYDLAFTGTNPQKLRLMLPHGAGQPSVLDEARVLISIFYSNPQKLEVRQSGNLIGPLEPGLAQSYNFSLRKPTVDDPCGSNAFAQWENKSAPATRTRA